MSEDEDHAGLVMSGDENNSDCDELSSSRRRRRNSKRSKSKRRASHAEENCPCRMRRTSWGKVKRTAAVPAVVAVAIEPEDKISVLVDEERGGGKWRRRSSTEKKQRKQKQRCFSVTSNSSSVSMLNNEGDERRGDCNNNLRGINGMEVDDEVEGVVDEREKLRRDDEEDRESINSSSSFTKDIMQMINKSLTTSQREAVIATDSNKREDGMGGGEVAEFSFESGEKLKNNRRFVNSNCRNSKGEEGTAAENEVILRMNRRNSDMSEGMKKRVGRVGVICECPCHEEVEVEELGRKKGRKVSLKSPNSQINIYSIEEPQTKRRGEKGEDEWEVGLEKGQLENRSDNNKSDYDDDDQREYDNDEIEFEDEELARRRRARGEVAL